MLWQRLICLCAGTLVFAALSAVAPNAEVAIESWPHANEGRAEGMEQVVQEFEACNSGIKVTMAQFPQVHHRTKVEAAMMAGEGHDAGQFFCSWLDHFAAAGFTQPLPTNECPPRRVEEEFCSLAAATRAGTGRTLR
ncbi:MAG: hypothetical protein OXB95_09655 [Rhodobacteraceae bacterium]|nr:hypothetical protein [Paracoccaceae bacterium]